MPSTIYVKHNAEIAHRLSQLPGKCQNIHGHSLQIELYLDGELNANGILEGLDFSSIKHEFRDLIDTCYDHHLLLNREDSLLRQISNFQHVDGWGPIAVTFYPGAVLVPGDPTIENIAKWIGQWSVDKWNLPTTVKVQETNTNGAMWTSED